MAGQPGSLLKGRSWDLAGGGRRVNVGSRGGKYQNVIGLIKGLVREPFLPGGRLGTSGEPSSSVNPLAKVVFFSRNPSPQAAAGKTSGPAFYDLRISSVQPSLDRQTENSTLLQGPRAPLKPAGSPWSLCKMELSVVPPLPLIPAAPYRWTHRQAGRQQPWPPSALQVRHSFPLSSPPLPASAPTHLSGKVRTEGFTRPHSWVANSETDTWTHPCSFAPLSPVLFLS